MKTTNKQKEKIEVPGILSSISFTKDNGLRIGFITQELTDEQKLIVQKFYQKFGYILFASNEFQEKDIPTREAEKGSKTPSQRLRSVLFLLYKQIGIERDFEIYYREMMEKLINKVKEKLD